MTGEIEALTIQGRTVHVTARHPPRVEPRVLALAAALRVFARYPVLDRLTLSVGGGPEIDVARDEVGRFLGPGGFAAIQDSECFRQVLGAAIQAYTGEEAG